MGIEIWQVDAFTDRPFAGNPAAVCPLPAPAEEPWMQAVAREMNLAETAFLWPLAAEGSAEAGLRLRWFTPALEVRLCGHATLASAHVLWQSGRLPAEAAARFLTRSGPLSARRLEGGAIELDFPRVEPVEAALPAGLERALGLGEAPRWAGRAGEDFFVEVGSEAELLGLAPDFRRLGELTAGDRGVIVTTRAERPGFDVVSRFFAPAAGVDEDPVTGSAHCALGAYWAPRLGKAELAAFQASARGGFLRVRPDGGRVRLAGRAVTVLRGELL
jgi:PhzF family phenazine biosynthesis protein